MEQDFILFTQASEQRAQSLFTDYVHSQDEGLKTDESFSVFTLE